MLRRFGLWRILVLYFLYEEHVASDQKALLDWTLRAFNLFIGFGHWSQIGGLFMLAMQRKWYGDKVSSRMFHLVNLLPHALRSVSGHEGGWAAFYNLSVSIYDDDGDIRWPENTGEVDHVAPGDGIRLVTADVQHLLQHFHQSRFLLQNRWENLAGPGTSLNG